MINNFKILGINIKKYSIKNLIHKLTIINKVNIISKTNTITKITKTTTTTISTNHKQLKAQQNTVNILTKKYAKLQ